MVVGLWALIGAAVIGLRCEKPYGVSWVKVSAAIAFTFGSGDFNIE